MSPTKRSLLLSGTILLGFVVAAGCGPTALPVGSTAPAIEVEGWVNGPAQSDLDGKVIVLEVFATW